MRMQSGQDVHQFSPCEINLHPLSHIQLRLVHRGLYYWRKSLHYLIPPIWIDVKVESFLKWWRNYSVLTNASEKRGGYNVLKLFPSIEWSLVGQTLSTACGSSSIQTYQNVSPFTQSVLTFNTKNCLSVRTYVLGLAFKKFPVLGRKLLLLSNKLDSDLFVILLSSVTRFGDFFELWATF